MINSKRATHPKTYVAWLNAKTRCFNKNYNFYQCYGGRGITMCDRWRYSFKEFLDDMGEVPLGYTLDRIDNDGHYEPGNCRWSTQKEQQRNRGNNRWLTLDGVAKVAAEWAEQTGLSESVINRRIGLGWAHERILKTPCRVVCNKIIFQCKERTLSSIAREFQIGRSTLWLRLKNGLTLEEALTTPVRNSGCKIKPF